MSNLSIWRDRHWVDISRQLIRQNIIHEADLSCTLLKKTNANGSWLWRWLVLIDCSHHYCKSSDNPDYRIDDELFRIVSCELPPFTGNAPALIHSYRTLCMTFATFS